MTYMGSSTINNPPLRLTSHKITHGTTETIPDRHQLHFETGKVRSVKISRPSYTVRDIFVTPKEFISGRQYWVSYLDVRLWLDGKVLMKGFKV